MSHTNEVLRSPVKLRHDDEDDETSRCDAPRPCYVLTSDILRSSFVVHSSSIDKTNCRSRDKSRDDTKSTAMNETCIWSSDYPKKRGEYHAPRITSATHVRQLDKKLPRRSRMHHEADTTGSGLTDDMHYSALTNDYQEKTCRNIFPQAHIRRQNDKLSFVESRV